MKRGWMLGFTVPFVPAALFAGVSVWTTNGPAGATSSHVVTDARIPGTLYVGTTRGVAKSTDGGRSWTPTFLLAGEPLAAAGGVIYASILTAVGPPELGG